MPVMSVMPVADTVFILGLLLFVAGTVTFITLNNNPIGSDEKEERLIIPGATCLVGLILLFAGASVV